MRLIEERKKEVEQVLRKLERRKRRGIELHLRPLKELKRFLTGDYGIGEVYEWPV